MKKLTLPLSEEAMRELRAGDTVLLTGSLYTGRDAAHKRLVNCLDEGVPLPVCLSGETIYYVGPAPARPSMVIGPAGPTTSYRMDAYTPQLLAQGLRVMIGKGKRSQAVVDAMKAYGAVYLGVTGGAAALVSMAITRAEVICYEDLGAEAIHRLEVAELPAVVLIDSLGNSLYETGPRAYREEPVLKEENAADDGGKG